MDSSVDSLPASPRIETRAVLKSLGFREEWNEITDRPPAYSYDFGTYLLTAAELMNRWFQPCFLLSGVGITRTSIGEIVFEMPLVVDSYEQGVAFIAYAVRDFPPPNTPPWLMDGWKWKDLLPWERQLRAYEARPHCVVEHAWFKRAANKLRELSTSADENALVWFWFDGETLQIRADGFAAALPASGKKWEKHYGICLAKLDCLSKRLPRQGVHISAWEGSLHIANTLWQVIGEHARSDARGQLA